MYLNSAGMVLFERLDALSPAQAAVRCEAKRIPDTLEMELTHQAECTSTSQRRNIEMPPPINPSATTVNRVLPNHVGIGPPPLLPYRYSSPKAPAHNVHNPKTVHS